MNSKKAANGLLFYPLLPISGCKDLVKYLYFRDGKFLDIVETFIRECFHENSLPVEESGDFLKFVKASIKNYVSYRYDRVENDVLLIGASCLYEFIRCNILGPSDIVNDDELLQYLLTGCSFQQVENLKRINQDLINFLSSNDDTVSSNIKRVLLLCLAKLIFASIPVSLSQQWWSMRCLYIHQVMLRDPSPCIHGQLIEIMKKIEYALVDIDNKYLFVMFYLEKMQNHLQLYSEISEVKDVIIAVHNILHLKEVKLGGQLGKRTRFQLRHIAQLTLDIEVDSESKLNETNELVENSVSIDCEYRSSYFPKDERLDDEVRLPQVQFMNSSEKPINLNAIQQSAILASFMLMKKSEPNDEILTEKLLVYLNHLIRDPQLWNIQATALLQRSFVETSHFRSIERSITQIQSLITDWEAPNPTMLERLPLVFCSYVMPKYELETNLARLLVQVGAIQSALDIYKKLEIWEEIVACYNHLKLRHKAEAVIRNEMAKGETVQLWCLLGDATDDVTCYEKAWEMSNYKSSKTQKHWGLFYLYRKQYEESIPHLEKSLKINSLQVPLWFNLGYSALVQEKWELSAKAYQRYCSLEPDCFEAWNNLAKAYIKLGQKNRAWGALQDAVKCNYDNWKVWDNLMVVSTDCAEFNEVIRCYHRILDIKGKHEDIEVLQILVNATRNKNFNSDAQHLKTKALQLFGRLTSMVMTNSVIWKLYASLIESDDVDINDQQKIVQCLLKAQRIAFQEPGWENTVEQCKNVIDLSLDLSRAQKICSTLLSDKQGIQHLQSAHLMLRGVNSRIRKCLTDASGVVFEELVTDVEKINEEIKDVETRMSK